MLFVVTSIVTVFGLLVCTHVVGAVGWSAIATGNGLVDGSGWPPWFYGPPQPFSSPGQSQNPFFYRDSNLCCRSIPHQHHRFNPYDQKRAEDEDNGNSESERESSKRCFDLSKCHTELYGFKQPSWSWTSPAVPFQWPDIQLRAICTCAASMSFGGRTSGEICCPKPRLPTPWATQEETRQEDNFENQTTTETEEPEIDIRSGSGQHKPPPHQTFWHEQEHGHEHFEFPKFKSSAEGNEGEKVSIHDLEWSPSIKSSAMRHPNLALLPGLDECGVGRQREREGSGTGSDRVVPYIIGGVDSKLGQQPWMALLGFYSSNPEFFPLRTLYGCGGTLINARYVLTAAHCLILPPGVNLTTVRLGEFDQARDPDCRRRLTFCAPFCAPPVQDVGVEQIIVHHEYNLDGRGQENDIALVRLAKPAVIGRYVAPICLPVHDFAEAPAEGGSPAQRPKTLTVAGWGRTQFNVVNGSDILQELMVPLVGKAECQEYFQGRQGIAEGRRFCAGGKMDMDSCLGDSGGPIMDRVTLKRTGATEKQSASVVPRMVQLGIVSIGREDGNCSMAGPGHLTLYTRVAHYIPWILDNIKA